MISIFLIFAPLNKRTKESDNFLSETHDYMKILFYAALLIFCSSTLPCRAQSQDNDRKYKKFYHSINKIQGNVSISHKQAADDVILDTITVAELDSIMKNMAGVTDILKGGKSLLKPVVILELDPNSSAAQALFGCIDTNKRESNVGKGVPDPYITGIPMVKKFSDKGGKTDIAATKDTDKPIVADNTIQSTKSSSTEAGKNSTSSSSGFKPFSGGNEWQLFRAVPVNFLDIRDKASLKRYSIVIGAFRSLNNANFAKRTFTGLGEKALVVSNDVGIYYTIIDSYNNESDAIKKLEEFTLKYTTNMSKTRRIAKYGLPLDDLWILIYNE